MFRSPLFSNKTVEIKKAPVAAKKKPGPKIVYFTEKDFKAKPATASTTPGGKGRRDPASANLSRAMIEHTRAPAGLDNQIAAAADSK